MVSMSSNSRFVICEKAPGSGSEGRFLCFARACVTPAASGQHVSLPLSCPPPPPIQTTRTFVRAVSRIPYHSQKARARTPARRHARTHTHTHIPLGCRLSRSGWATGHCSAVVQRRAAVAPPPCVGCCTLRPGSSAPQNGWGGGGGGEETGSLAR